MTDRDGHVFAATIELEQLTSLWTHIREDVEVSMAIAIATADGLICWRRPVLDRLVGEDASKGPFFQAIR